MYMPLAKSPYSNCKHLSIQQSFQIWYLSLLLEKQTIIYPQSSVHKVLCMGAQASIILESLSWLSHVALFAQRRELISPISVGRVAVNQSHTCSLRKVFIVTYLSFREAKPRVRESGCLNTQGSEAVLKVQLQRRVGKNYV